MHTVHGHIACDYLSPNIIVPFKMDEKNTKSPNFNKKPRDKSNTENLFIWITLACI